MITIGKLLIAKFDFLVIDLHPVIIRWGNILFLIGSIGYLITAEAYFYGVYAYEAAWGNLSLAILFQIDSILYVFEMNQGSTSKADTNVAVLRSADQKRLGVIKVFISELDYYFLATVGFIIGTNK